ATFTVDQHTLTVAKAGTGDGTVGGGGAFEHNAPVTPTATAANGSTFAGWEPPSCGSTFNLTADTTCTATFTANPPPACAATAPVSVTRGGVLYNRATKRYEQTLTVTNTSGSAVAGPIDLVLDNLSSNATLANASGTTSCTTPAPSPYITVGSGPLNPSASLTVKLSFISNGQAITYNTRVLSGTGNR
ncbi:MAG: hypothetical protein LM522_05420, partial [Candidatus Contendobacter sp.]|nr:hypothetical protein [Candidatus Contendobacter sp.]